MADLGPLTHILRRVRRRLRWQRTLDRSAWALLGSFGVLTVAVAGERFGQPWLDWAVPLAVSIPLLAALVSALERIPLLRAAHAVDHAHDLDDRVQNALQFVEQRQTATPFMQAAIRDAVRHGEQLSPKRAAPVHAPHAIRYSVPAALLLALARFTPLPAPSASAPPPQLTAAPRPPTLDADSLDAFEDELRKLREEGGLSEQGEELAQEYERVLAELASGELTREQALEQLAELQSKLEAARAGHTQALAQALERLAASLGESQAAEAVAEALARSDLSAAADALDELAREVSRKQLSERKRRELEQALKKAAEKSRNDEGERSLLKKKNRREPGSEANQEPSLLDKKRELERLRREQQAADEARRQLEKLRREMQKAGQNLQQPGGAQHLEQAARNMRNLSQQGMDAEQQRKLAEQLSQLRQQLQRQRQAQGQQQGQGGPQQQGQGQQGGQSQRLKRFSMRARGQDPQDEGTPLVMRKPGQKGGKSQQQKGAGQPGKKGDEGDQGKKPSEEAQRVLELGGEGQPNAQLEMPQLMTEQRQQGGGSGGDESDDSRTDPRDRLAGKLQDSQVAGQAARGPSRSEVIFGAADQGFATTPYSKVYTDYQTHAETVLERDEIPAGYRYYVKRYFQLIRPREGDTSQ